MPEPVTAMSTPGQRVRVHRVEDPGFYDSRKPLPDFLVGVTGVLRHRLTNGTAWWVKPDPLLAGRSRVDRLLYVEELEVLDA